MLDLSILKKNTCDSVWFLSSVLMNWLPCSSDIFQIFELIRGQRGRPQSEHRSDVYGYTQIKAKCQSTEGSIVKGKY